MHKDLVQNKKAFFDYEILDKFEAGIVLKGSEIKSLRNHSASLSDSFVDIINGEVWLLNSYIAPYEFSRSFTHEERRKRKLLMHKNEISRLKKAISEKGLTIIPLKIFLKNSVAKVEIAIAKGRKHFDKREKLKEKSEKKEIQKALKYK
ncbi:MAG: SsrA-binding protein [Chlamydiae bacterium RIFCSPHIGHO2_12_FULL_27_8]|nr:MAG: SsrA-binding protein [Chlamydiae bacterium RIFCSPHIGHO2_12_FULL_27_8]OGN64881.1 MAG: SsrA-binding protein [Chlamydiae bacterium RIFCSPLOWO2_01_FULL_28_7]